MLSKIQHPGTILGPKQYQRIPSHAKGIDKLKVEIAKWTGPNTLTTLDIGPSGNGLGHNELVGDCMQSYRLVLLFLATNDVQAASNAASIIMSWSTNCKEAKGSNIPLELAWATTVLTRSAEILKYKWSGWTAHHDTQFNNFLNSLAIPNLLSRFKEIERWRNNWILTILEALIQIYIFQNNITKLNSVISDYIRIAPTTFIGSLGQNTEITRDLVHSQFQLCSHIQIAEMLFHQGFPTFYDKRLLKSIEYHASILNGKIPIELNGITLKDVWLMPSSWEIAFNHFVNRKKEVLPETTRLLQKPRHRPEGMAFNWGPGWTHEQSF